MFDLFLTGVGAPFAPAHPLLLGPHGHVVRYMPCDDLPCRECHALAHTHLHAPCLLTGRQGALCSCLYEVYGTPSRTTDKTPAFQGSTLREGSRGTDGDNGTALARHPGLLPPPFDHAGPGLSEINTLKPLVRLKPREAGGLSALHAAEKRSHRPGELLERPPTQLKILLPPPLRIGFASLGAGVHLLPR